MTTDGGTVAIDVFEEFNVIVVSLLTGALAVTVRNPLLPTVIFCPNGASCNDSCGIEIEPLTSAMPPLATVSFVAAEPPSSVNCVNDGSSVRVIELPGAADGDNVKTRCATRFPGAAALRVNGIRFVDS